MKRAVTSVMIIIVLLSAPFCAAAQSGAFLIMDGRFGTVLEEQNGYARLPMASTTKVMTALVALELLSLEERVTIPPEAAGTEGSSLYMKAGEEYTVEELLYGLLLQSANDCAMALAWQGGSGNIDSFVVRMNAFAAELGLHNTQYKNPSGLSAEGHYTTAQELALLMKAAMQNEVFRKITGTKRYTVHGTTITNHNRLLSTCGGCIGGKTGYTMEAGRCLVSVTEREDIPLIAVTLGIHDDWEMHSSAYDRWFSKLHEVVLAEKGALSYTFPIAGGGTVRAVNARQITAFVFADIQNQITLAEGAQMVYGNKPAGAVVGTVWFCSGEVKIAESPLILTAEVKAEVRKELFITRLFRFFRQIFLKKSE